MELRIVEILALDAPSFAKDILPPARGSIFISSCATLRGPSPTPDRSRTIWNNSPTGCTALIQKFLCLLKANTSECLRETARPCALSVGIVAGAATLAQEQSSESAQCNRSYPLRLRLDCYSRQREYSPKLFFGRWHRSRYERLQAAGRWCGWRWWSVRRG